MIGTRIHRARKGAALSLRALGDAVGVSQTMIKKYEDGIATPSSTMLLALARALDVRTEYFFRADTVVLDHIEYRKRNALPKKRLDAITQTILDQVERRIELENLFPTPPTPPFQIPDELPVHVSSVEEAEDVASVVRSAWELGLDPIPCLIDLLEQHGLRVFTVETDPDDKFDGLAATAGGVPVVVVGSHWPGDRQRFTLAHELGHRMLENRLIAGVNEEAACNRFAGAFLFPRASVFEALGSRRHSIEPRELSLIKEEFGLSMAAVLYRARDLNIVTDAYRTEQLRRFSASGWRRCEPGSMYPREKTHRFEQLVFHALAEDYIGESKAAELLGVPLSKFRSIRALESDGATAHQ